MAKLLVIYFIIKGWLFMTSRANPTGCTYDTNLKEYSCSQRYWSLPLKYSDFSQPVQVLKLTEINGQLAATPKTFDGFSAHSTTNFDPYVDPRLEIICYESGSVIFEAGAFANMGWVKDLRIKDCRIQNLPDNVFQEIGDLNFFGIEGGSLANNVGYNAFNGLNVAKLDVPEPKGIVSIRNTRFIAASLQNGFLYPFANATRVELENINLRAPAADIFYALTKATYISLANNPFFELDEKIFSKASSLQQLNLTGIPWTCSCSKIWPYQWAQSNNVSLYGGFICDYPSEVKNMRGQYYNRAYNCEEAKPCGDLLGIKISDTYCLLVTDMVLYGVTLIAFILSLVGFSMACHMWRQLPSKPKEPKPTVTQTKPLDTKKNATNTLNNKGSDKEFQYKQTTKIPPKTKETVSQEEIVATLPPKKMDNDYPPPRPDYRKSQPEHPPKPDFRQKEPERKTIPRKQQQEQKQQPRQPRQTQHQQQQQQRTEHPQQRQQPQQRHQIQQPRKQTTEVVQPKNKPEPPPERNQRARTPPQTYRSERFDPMSPDYPPSYRSGTDGDYRNVDYGLNQYELQRRNDPRGLPPPYSFHPDDGFI